MMTPPIFLEVCAVENGDVERGLENVEEKLGGEELEEALQTMLVIGEGAQDCEEVEVC